MKMTPEHEAKFRKVLGLLGSDQDGERANAAKIANAYLKQYKLTWADVADSFFAKPTVTPNRSSPYTDPESSYMAPENEKRRAEEAAKSRERQARAARHAPPEFRPVDHQSMANDLLSNWTERITEWETNFLRSIRNRRELTAKQEACLTRIYERVQGEASVWSR